MIRRLLLLGSSLVLALVGTGLVFTYVSAADARALAGQEPVRVLVVQSDVPAGASAQAAVADGRIALQDLPRTAVPSQALTSTDTLTGLVTSSPLSAGEVLVPARFESPNRVGALDIAEGNMAVSVELTDQGRVAGFVVPGSEVAVFATIARPGADGQPEEEATRLLLPRVTVLATGPTAMRPADAQDGADPVTTADEAPVATSVLTLSVNQEEAEKLVHATQTGRPYFALLTPTSASAPSASTTTTSTLLQ